MTNSKRANEEEILKQFQSSESGVDCSFNELSEEAQGIAFNIMHQCKTQKRLRMALDRSDEFRVAVNSSKENLQETDAVMRFWPFFKESLDEECR